MGKNKQNYNTFLWIRRNDSDGDWSEIAGNGFGVLMNETKLTCEE